MTSQNENLTLIQKYNSFITGYWGDNSEVNKLKKATMVKQQEQRIILQTCQTQRVAEGAYKRINEIGKQIGVVIVPMNCARQQKFYFTHAVAV